MKTRLTKLFIEFFESEQASGLVLLGNTALALLLANSLFSEQFLAFWNIPLGFELGSIDLQHTIEHWINDGLMAIFFLLIGLEIEREIYTGELSDLKNASLPIFAALGGMLMPALIHFAFNRGTPQQAGFGIPMATDIAFALGALAILGSRVPASLKVFLTALAIIDDLGAIIVITLFYSHDFAFIYLLAGLAIFVGLLFLNTRKVKNLAAYLLPGLVMWYCIQQSGIHAAISGVLLAFAIPFFDGREKSPSYKLQRFLHKPVAFLVMPLFALANTGIVFSGTALQALFSFNTLGIITGLYFGKPLGIVLFSFLAVRARLSKLPMGISYRHMLGAGFLGGIGFTMSIFVTYLAFGDTPLAQVSKIAIITGSLLAGSTGLLILNWKNQFKVTGRKEPK